MLYTHLSRSHYPLLLAIIMTSVFCFLLVWFAYGVYWPVLVSLFLLLIVILSFFASYQSELLNYSSIQFFLNQQFFYYFVVSEVFFFFGVLWALFWYLFCYETSSIFFTMDMYIDPFGLALFNTFLLLASSSFCVSFHIMYSVEGLLDLTYLVLTILLGFWFLVNQFIEFRLCPYTISMISFTSIFFLSTGFHGAHVFLGLIMLTISLVAIYSYGYYQYHGLLNCVFLYWHFVDVVWLFLFAAIYIWGS